MSRDGGIAAITGVTAFVASIVAFVVRERGWLAAVKNPGSGGGRHIYAETPLTLDRSRFYNSAILYLQPSCPYWKTLAPPSITEHH